MGVFLFAGDTGQNISGRTVMRPVIYLHVYLFHAVSQQPTLWFSAHQQGALQFNPVLTPTARVSTDRTGYEVNPTKLPPPAPGCHRCVRLTSCPSRVPTAPTSGLIFPLGSANGGTCFTAWTGVLERVQFRNSQRGAVRRARGEEGVWSRWTLSGHTARPAPQCAAD